MTQTVLGKQRSTYRVLLKICVLSLLGTLKSKS